MRFRNLLQQPIRIFNTNKKKWAFILSSAIFASLFILIYTPFGLAEEMEKPTTTAFRIAAFVGTEVISIGVILYIFQFQILKHYPGKTMSLKKTINFFLLQMLCISVLHNTLDTILTYEFFPHELFQEPDDIIDEYFEDNTPVDFILECIFFTIPQIFILSYPFMGCLLYFNITDLKEEVDELESELKQFKTNYKEHKNDHIGLELRDENDQIEHIIHLDQLLALESNNQYVLVYYLDTEQTLCKQIIRTRLKKMLSELEHTPTLQCHRSYAVNLLNVEQLKTIDKKSFLTLSGTDQIKIPVSKTYLPQIKNKLT